MKYVLHEAYSDEVNLDSSHNVFNTLGKIADEDNTLPFISPIRDPYDTVSSRIVWLASEYGDALEPQRVFPELEHLTAYWELLLTFSERFCIVNFNELISDKDLIISKVNLKYPQLALFKRKSSMSESSIKVILNSHDDEEYANDKEVTLARGHLPREKSKYKDSVAETLSSDLYKKRFEYLNLLYAQLLDLAI